MSPPRNAMSDPARIGTWKSATALVRVKRGSTWMILAPFNFAFMGQRNATGWHSAMFEPMTMKQSVCSRLRGYEHGGVPSGGVPLAHEGEVERHRMALRHVRAHDDEAVGMFEH